MTSSLNNVTAENADELWNHTSQNVEQVANFSSTTGANGDFINFMSTFSVLNKLSIDSISSPLSTSSFQYSQVTNVTDLATKSTLFQSSLGFLTSTSNLTTTTLDPEIRLLNDVSRYLWVICCPIIFLVGMIGNGFTLAVLRRMRFWKKPSLFILVPLAFTDMIVLCTGLSRYWIKNTFDFDIRTVSNAGCKINLFVIYISMQYSSWILVCFTMERFLKTNYPFKHRTFMTVKKEAIALCIIFIVLTGVDGHYFWSNGLVSNGTECGSVTPDFFHFEEYIFTYIDLTVLSALPAVLMIIMNVKIALVLKKSRDFVQQSVQGIASTHYQRFNRKLTRMLLITNTYFVLATIPISVYFIVDSYTEGISDLVGSQKELALSVVYILQYTNYAVNFFLYTTSNAQFRRHLKAILNRRSSGRIIKSVQSSINTSSTRVEDDSCTETEATVHDDPELDRPIAEADINIEMNISEVDDIQSSENIKTETKNLETHQTQSSGNSETEMNNPEIVQIQSPGHGKTEMNNPKIYQIQSSGHGKTEMNNPKIYQIQSSGHGELELNNPEIDQIQSSRNGETEMNNPKMDQIQSSGHGKTEMNNPEIDQIQLSGNGELELNNPEIDQIQSSGHGELELNNPEIDQIQSSRNGETEMNNPKMDQIQSSGHGKTEMNNPEIDQIQLSGNGELELNNPEIDQIQSPGNDGTENNNLKIDQIQKFPVMVCNLGKKNFEQGNNDPIQRLIIELSESDVEKDMSVA